MDKNKSFTFSIPSFSNEKSNIFIVLHNITNDKDDIESLYNFICSIHKMSKTLNIINIYVEKCETTYKIITIYSKDNVLDLISLAKIPRTNTDLYCDAIVYRNTDNIILEVIINKANAPRIISQHTIELEITKKEIIDEMPLFNSIIEDNEEGKFEKCDENNLRPFFENYFDKTNINDKKTNEIVIFNDAALDCIKDPLDYLFVKLFSCHARSIMRGQVSKTMNIDQNKDDYHIIVNYPQRTFFTLNNLMEIPLWNIALFINSKISCEKSDIVLTVIVSKHDKLFTMDCSTVRIRRIKFKTHRHLIFLDDDPKSSKKTNPDNDILDLNNDNKRKNEMK